MCRMSLRRRISRADDRYYEGVNFLDLAIICVEFWSFSHIHVWMDEGFLGFCMRFTALRVHMFKIRERDRKSCLIEIFHAFHVIVRLLHHLHEVFPFRTPSMSRP